MADKIDIKIDKDNHMDFLPVIALRGMVIFPESLVHFDLGREKSINALQEAMNEDRTVFLVPQIDSEVDEPQANDLHKIGVVAKIKQIIKLNDGFMKVLIDAKYRAKVEEYDFEADYISALVKLYPINKVKAAQKDTLEAFVRIIKETFESYMDVAPKMGKEVIFNVFAIDDGNMLAEYIATNVMFKIEDKMAVLKENSVEKRLKYVLDFLNNEYNVLQIEADIKSKVQYELEKNQKEYYLRQQIRTLSQELDTSEDGVSETEEYKNKINELSISEDSKVKLLKELTRLERMSSSSQEAAVIRTYLDTCLDIPWSKETKEQVNISKAEKILDKKHYGMEKVKDKVLEILAVRQLSDKVKGQIICLVGPPGVGKTSIASSIAECLNRNFVRVSLGGVRDESEIRGHRRTYVGAMPGKIVNSFIGAKSNNPVILLDEIDKLAGDFRGDPAAALLEVLDSEQNMNFKDHYIDLPLDLSNVFFIATANNYSSIPRPLLDRMDIIELSSYTREEKFNIAKKHLIPKQLDKNGVKKLIKFNNSAIYEMIDGYTKESGVRNLERVIISIIRKSAKIIAKHSQEVVSVDKNKVIELLGPEKFKTSEMNLSNKLGVANGLAYTSVGGEMLPIEVTVIPNGTGKSELTGSLGNVMKESCRIALSYIKANAKKYKIETEFSKIDIHIHAPEGAVPKDGPSAGITLTTALISVLTKKKVKGDVAMTGEVTLQGRVLPIGGLKEKAMAAYREGMKTVIIPFDNEPNLYDVDKVIKEKIKFIPVKSIDEALEANLC